jgi:hypothetical protein
MNSDSIYNKTRLAFGLVMLFAPFLVSGTSTASYQRKTVEKEFMQNQSDNDIIAALASKDEEKAHYAVVGVMKRGERMIPLLVQCKGNKQFFYGYGLGDKSSAFTTPAPTGTKKLDDGSVITIEVAALYLISAIYYETLEFAQAPYLTDGTPVQWQKFNTSERVSKAWDSVEAWMKAFKSGGIESLRSRQQSPLTGSKVHFWGSS